MINITNIEGKRSEASPLPLTPPVPPDTKPEKTMPLTYTIMSRRGVGSKGRRIPLLTNHFGVSVNAPDLIFYQYSDSICYEDNGPVEGKEIGRKLMDKLYQTYSTELANKRFAYDGEKCLYCVGPLPQNKLEFTVVLEGSYAKLETGRSGGSGSPNGIGKRSKRSFQSKTFKVELSFATKIPMKSIFTALKGEEVDNGHSQDALRVLDIILRQQAANQGCLLVRQSFFHDDSRNFADVGGGVTGVRGFHSSFRLAQDGLSLNMDVSTTMILKPGPVIDFLIANQNVREPRYIDWVKAKRMLKNLRVKASHRNMESKIIGLSEKPCNQQFFSMKLKNNGSADGQMLCSLVSLQRYTKALSLMQRASLVEKSRQKPQEKIKFLTDALKNYQYDEDPVLAQCGLKIDRQPTQVEGRVLESPKLEVGKSDDCIPRNGRWNFNNKHIERPITLIEEDQHSRRASPVDRVENMFEQTTFTFKKIPGRSVHVTLAPLTLHFCPHFILLIGLFSINSFFLFLYIVKGPWKKCLCDFEIVTQCISPTKINDQYITNVLLKINSKLGGINSLLAIEHAPCVPLIKDTPTLILGMDVSHGSPGRSDVPSIAAVVGSRSWPLISRELLLDFYKTSNGRKPTQIIVFRDEVSESQFNQVLNIELDQIVKAYQHLGEVNVTKFTVIVGQKNHHTKFFQPGAPENVPPGTVVDTKVVHPKNYDFYMCAHAGMIGTSRPAHYHVLLDEIGFSPDDLQNLIHSLSYVYQRSTTALSIAAPICYAHLAASQMSQFINFEELSETSSERGTITSSGSLSIPELPRLHKDVNGSMFFC
ncbi:Protein argonaute 16, partial [Cucurbita argyrosperma subsp. argyrosperma]